MEYQQFTLSEHLKELRKRLLIITIAVFLVASICFAYIEKIVALLIAPAEALNFIYISPPELFLAYIKIAIALGSILSMPLILGQVWLFLKPGLKKKEKKYVFFSMVMGWLFFLLGSSFAYSCVLPLMLNFFVGMSIDLVTPLFSFSNYINFISGILISFGLVFELPIVVMLLTFLQLVNPEQLKKHRKFVCLGIFVMAAVLTPPDIVSQIFMGVPMLLLFEVSIFISKGIYKKGS